MAEQVIAHTTGGFAACTMTADETLRDSVCWNTVDSGIGAQVSAVSGGPFVSNIRNVTAVATGTGSFGIEVRSVNMDVQQAVVAKNVIADGVLADVHAVAGVAGSSATATLSTSNYATELEDLNAGIAAVTNPGPPNQTAPPLFTDAAVSLFHQATGSPTIDAGAAVDLLGSADIDGDSRTLSAAPDIGADEFVPSTPPVVLTPPVVAQPFNLAAAIKRCKKKFPKGSTARKRCISKAKARALARTTS